ncbi:FAD-dependent oxidoreductase [Salinifilum aidingensis]
MREVAVVGGGIIGLSCAWHLLQRGVGVTVWERQHVGAGASWGNAGQLEPSLAVPLPEPSNVRAALRSLVDRDSAVLLPRRVDRELAAFLRTFLTRSTTRTWRRAVRAQAPLNARALSAYDELVDAGVPVSFTRAPFTSVAADAAEADGLLHELSALAAGGYRVDHDVLTADELHAAEPITAGSRAAVGVRINGQRFLDPPRTLEVLADGVRSAGGEVREGQQVQRVAERGGRVRVDSADDTAEVDAVVLANGAWLSPLGREHGVRMPMHAGRGYSFQVQVPTRPNGMVHFAGPRIACTPFRDGVRVSSLMELEKPDAGVISAHAERFRRQAERVLPEADWSTATDMWVGPRPLTGDGLPLIGPTRTPGVYAAGGHGMWGVTLGPLTGRLVAQLLVDGHAEVDLAAFDPRR